MRRLRLLPVLALSSTLAAHASDPQVLALDDARSRATFEVKVLYLIGLHGEFSAVHGTLSQDPFAGTAMVDATIDAGTVHMRNRRYENWVKSPEFFDAVHYPQIHFVSEPFPAVRLTSGGKIEGTLTIRGTSKPVAFTIDPADCQTPLSGACSVDANGTIRRSDFGMRSRRGALSDKVDLDLTIFVRSAHP
jgi:polyisoprenoid-binding protein YceI